MIDVNKETAALKTLDTWINHYLKEAQKKEQYALDYVRQAQDEIKRAEFFSSMKTTLLKYIKTAAQ